MAGVSPGAVSFALNGRPGVSDETRQRILDIAAEHQWAPSSTARALVGARAGVIGFAVNRAAGTLGTEAFFAELIAGVQGVLAPTRTAMQMVVVGSLAEEIDAYRRWRSARQVDGVIVIDPRDNDPRLSALRDIGLPAIVVGSRPSEPGHPAAIWLDDGHVARTLFDYLAAIGHRHIAYIAGPAEFQHTRMRTEVLLGLADRGVVGEVLATDGSPAAAAVALRSMLSRAQRPTAVVFDSDVMALAGLRVAQEMRVAVPTDLSLASFDDSVVAELVRPSITCISRDTVALGADAAAFLLEQIDATAILPDRVGALPHLTVRESTDAPRPPAAG